jgi:hypothetical protein
MDEDYDKAIEFVLGKQGQSLPSNISKGRA